MVFCGGCVELENRLGSFRAHAKGMKDELDRVTAERDALLEAINKVKRAHVNHHAKDRRWRATDRMATVKRVFRDIDREIAKHQKEGA